MKNYFKYMKSLRSFARSAKIKVKVKEGDFDGGEYNHYTRTIYLDPDVSKETRIACFLHELGHAFDETFTDKTLNKTLSRAYNRYYDGSTSKLYQGLVLQCEIRAWDYGKALAKLLGIPTGRWYPSIRNKYLRTYREDS